jgi:tetratricopeptide (TPR) repeat protein
VSIIAYLLKALWPARLAIMYPFRQPVPAWELIASLIAFALLTWLCVSQRRRRPWLLLGWLWYLGMLLPVSGLVPVGWQAMADRYTYLPLIGITLAVAWGDLPRLSPGAAYGPRLRGALTLTACLLLALVTRRQITYWTDGVRLFSHAIEVTDDNWLARFNLGCYLLDRGRYREAEENLVESLRLMPEDAEAQNTLGMARFYLGNLTGAADAFVAAATLSPRDPRPWCNLGNIRQAEGRAAEAVAAFEEALTREPGHAPSHHNLGNLLIILGDRDRGIEHLRRAAELDPASPRMAEALSRALGNAPLN